jgi:hypothetical protein
MSITSDAGESALQESHYPGQKVMSVDVDKVGQIYTNVPTTWGFKGKGGKARVRLVNYFKEIEKRITMETEARKRDIVAIRIKMAKNRAYNAKARKAMRKMLLHKMAINAKTAKRNLDAAMRRTAEKFHKVHVAENKRFHKNLKRSRALRRTMRRNKRLAAKQLHEATANQQRALATLDQQMNVKIRQTNKDIAANAAQIKINAKKARDELDAANNRFNKQMFAVTKEAQKGRHRLNVMANNMDKRTRAVISGQIKAETSRTAAEFAKTRKKMADDRHHADLQLKNMATKLSAGLHAAKLLQDKRYAKTQRDIAAAKKEANDMINKMKKGFKLQILHLRSTATSQITKLNARQKQLQGVVTKNKLEQAQVNKKVDAELKRMVKLGNKHEATLAKNDKALSALIKKNKASNEKAMLNMAKKFNSDMDKIRKQMKKDRAHAERNLKKQTGALYSTLMKNEKAQNEKNKELNAQRTRAKLDAEDALRKAKKDFTSKLAGLSATIVANDKKADAKIKKLTGIVDENAAKDAEGRKALRLLSHSNKLEMGTAIKNAVHAGEMRALQVEKTAKALNAKTRDHLNMVITQKIGKLAKHIHSSVEDLRLSTKSARAEMKREILYAVREAAAEAKKNLGQAVKWANGEFKKLDGRLAKEKSTSAAGRKALKDDIAKDKKEVSRAIKDAVANQNKALLALKTVTEKKIKKTNRRVDAYGAQIKKHATEVSAQMKSNAKTLRSKLSAAKKKAKTQLTNANKASIKRTIRALGFISKSVKAAEKSSNDKFGKLYKDLAKNRMEQDKKLASAAIELQEVIAKRSALYDARFRKTVKSIKLARKEAYGEVVQARKAFTTGMAAIVSSIKDQETRLQGEIEIVGTEVASYKAQQIKVNRKVDGELKRILKLSDTRYKESRKARGAIRRILNEHKAVAYAERNALAKSTKTSLRKLRAYQSKLRREAAEDLSKATKTLYGALEVHKGEQKKAHKKMHTALGNAKININSAMSRAKKEFQAKLMTLTNSVTSNRLKFEIGLNKLTNVAHDWKDAAGKDRALLKDQVSAMEKDLNKAIVKAIQIGEAKAKAVQERGMANVNAAKKALAGEISERVEKMADEVFKAVLDNRGKIADNYLALKAYCGSAADEIIDYTSKYNGKGLFALGDMLGMVAGLSGSKTAPAEGVGAGGSKVPHIFSSKKFKVSSSFTKTNGLVTEWSKVLAMVRSRWPYGIGHYLLGKIQYAMQNKGLLSVGEIEEKSGQFVHINAHAIGLSNRWSTLTKFASRSTDYQDFLTKLTAKLPKKMKVVKYSVPAKTFGKKGYQGA